MITQNHTLVSAKLKEPCVYIKIIKNAFVNLWKVTNREILKYSLCVFIHAETDLALRWKTTVSQIQEKRSERETKSFTEMTKYSNKIQPI